MGCDSMFSTRLAHSRCSPNVDSCFFFLSYKRRYLRDEFLEVGFLGQWGIWIVLSHPAEWGPVSPHSHQHQGGGPKLASVPHWLTAASPPSLPSSWPNHLCVYPVCLDPLCSRAFHGCLLLPKSSSAQLSPLRGSGDVPCPAPFLFRALSILCKHYTQTLLVHWFVASRFLGGWIYSRL